LNFNSAIASVGTQFANGLKGTEASLTAAFLNESDAPEPTTITTYVTDPANASIDNLSADINAGIESGKASVSNYFGSKIEKQSKP
jgi:hypothetical protein